MSGVTKVSSNDDLEWYRRLDQDLLLADAIDQRHDAAMTVGFVRYGAGESNPWTVSYDEALIVTKGRYSVESGGVVTTASAGEVIYLRAGTDLVYRAEEESEVVYVSYPHWMAATEQSPHKDRLAEFQPVTDLS
ncbi:ethanolamine utilization protein EutQ [Jiangella mangrovi]|uniref:Ethanolamine utilization protein EutQ n=2 Tax=Jiangella mangrovi TaxID=1524084 RepID=A0A7W9GKU2_9ACTN|nr:ethanolamine utilization protein EutQ [Jiangella mangrovi]